MASNQGATFFFVDIQHINENRNKDELERSHRSSLFHDILKMIVRKHELIHDYGWAFVLWINRRHHDIIVNPVRERCG